MSPVPTFSAWQTALTDAASNFLISIALFLPNLLGAIILFLIGLLLAKWFKKITVRLLSGINLSRIFKGTAVSKFFKKAEFTAKIEEALGEVVRLITTLIFFVASINLLGLTTVTQVLDSLLAYLPNIFAAVLVLSLGVIIAGIVEGLVKGSLGAVDIKIARLLAKISSYVVIIFTVLATFSQLNIAASFVNTLFTGFIAMLALGLGLSLGLGSKDLVKQLLEDWHQNFKRQTR